MSIHFGHLIQWLKHKIDKQRLGPIINGEFSPWGLLQLYVLLDKKPYTVREWRYAEWLLEHGLGAFDLRHFYLEDEKTSIEPLDCGTDLTIYLLSTEKLCRNG